MDVDLRMERTRVQIPPLRVYLDTSVLGGYYDAEFKEASKELWQRFEEGRLIPLVGEQTVVELAEAPEEVRSLLDTLPNLVEPLAINQEAVELARAYIEETVVLPKWQGDALHVATAVVHGVCVLLSWNFRHMANLQRNRAFNAVNLKLGYPQVDIRSPREVIHDNQATD